MKNIITDNIFEGIETLKEAISLYESGNFNEGSALLREASAKITEASDRSMTKEGRMTMLYGDDRNFGIAYKVFDENLHRLSESEEGMRTIAALASMIRNDENLSRQFKAYEAVGNASLALYPMNEDINSSDIISIYLQHVISENRIADRNAMVESNERFISAMEDAGLDENVIIGDETIGLYESISRLISENVASSNVATFAMDMNSVISHVKSLLEARCECGEKSAEELISDSYDALNDDERELVDSVKNGDAEKMFREAKESARKAVVREMTENGDADGQWAKVLEDIEGKEFSNDTALVNISEMIEIANTIEE